MKRSHRYSRDFGQIWGSVGSQAGFSSGTRPTPECLMRLNGGKSMLLGGGRGGGKIL